MPLFCTKNAINWLNGNDQLKLIDNFVINISYVQIDILLHFADS